jgi:two-component system response regulator
VSVTDEVCPAGMDFVMTADVNKQFGIVLKAWRKKLQLSQEKLAGRAGLHRTYVADIERGARNPSLQSLQKLAVALELPLSDLFQPFNRMQTEREPGLRLAEVVDILLVEHDPGEVERTLESFRKAPLANRIHVARGGADALEYLWGTGSHANAPLRNRPRLILLEWNLPKVSGADVLQSVRRHPATRGLPVVALTGSMDSGDIDESRRLGADDCLVKPVDFQALSRVTPRLSLRWVLVGSVVE